MSTRTSVKLQLLEVLPDPVSLIESMRAVGYTVEAAVADIVDNSISADAENISIEYDASEAPYVAILDDGAGMAPAELTEAMRHGRNPSDARESNDLGRFGLGLKTASMSQCRKLTVVSKNSGITSARVWDLDVVQRTEKWVIVIPPESVIRELPLFKKLDQYDSGTLVVWQQLDRLIAGSNRPQAEMTLKFHAMEGHLALVFHRFKQREGGIPPIAIELNGRPLPHRDPFLKSNSFRQPLEGQTIKHKHGNVIVTPYILPPISHLTPDEIELTGGLDGLKSSQGYYIYRARRLVIWGTWFRLVPKEEFYKLSRIQVDIPNTFDELWGLDIKKSAAFPPDVIRSRLKEITPHFVDKSKLAVTYRGKKASPSSTAPLWIRSEPKHNAFQYSINREHPLQGHIASLLDKEGLRKFELLLSLLESALPLESIYADMCNDKRETDIPSLEECMTYAKNLMEILGFPIETVLKMEPLDRYQQHHDKLKQGLKT
jgi:hypothetical protein